MSKDNTTEKIYKAPVVTVMGHVDHGKTTLLDKIRHANVADKEFGGITQKIGGYQISHKGKKITFIDTPGHEAFSEMRQRGASVTDIIVLVVAADDGIQNQTREVINIYKKSNVQMIVAVNKIDMPGSNPEKVKRELASEGLSLEGWGGDIPVVEISAKMGTNIDGLLDTIQLVAELSEIDQIETYKPDPSIDYLSESVIIESYVDKALGPVATCIVKAGKISRGDFAAAGGTYGKIRALIDQNNKTVSDAIVSDPILIVGLTTVQNTGEIVRTYANDKLARQNSTKSINEQIEEERQEIIEEISDQFDFFNDDQEENTFRIILKSDTKGSMDAIIASLEKLDITGIKLKIQSKSLGPVNLSDVEYASSTKSLIIAFNVEVPKGLETSIKAKKVLIREYKLIYQLLEELEMALYGLTMPEEEEVIIGTANVKSLFILSNKSMVAGCEVKSGKIIKGYKVAVERKGERIHEGKIVSLRHLKDEVKEMSVGAECGIVLDPGFDIQTGDKMIVFKMEKS
ncbi:MAG: translation initiation factor IF-2 [bacterium]